MQPNPGSWVSIWSRGKADRQAAAEAVAKALGAFLTDLEQRGRSTETIALHVQQLELLGEIITSFLAADPRNLAKGVDWYFANLMADGTGPVPPGLKRKAEIRAYQGTCRQLIRFVRQQRLARAAPSA